MPTIKVGKLNQTNPDYHGDYWKCLAALAHGGHRLTRNPEVLTQLLPRHNEELDDVYEKRLSRVVYQNISGSVIFYLASQLASDPLRAMLGEAPAPEYWKDFLDNCSRSNYRELSLNMFLRKQVQGALIYGSAWTMALLPDRQARYINRAEQEQDGALSVTLQSIRPEAIIDWECDDDGNVLYAVHYAITSKRAGLGEARGATTHTWTYYTQTGWERYERKYPKGRTPDANDDVELIGEGELACMPLSRLCLGDLWAMDQLESLATEHMRKDSNISWFEAQSLNQQLYEFLETPKSAPTTPGASNALAKEPSGPGWTKVRKAGDRVEYVAPKSDVFAYAQSSKAALKDEIYRQLHTMTLAADMGSAALSRSGESKSWDKASESVFLQALGIHAREHAAAIMNIASALRGEYDAVGQWKMAGMELFTSQDDRAILDNHSLFKTLDIKSPHLHSIVDMLSSDVFLAKASATEDDRAIIQREIKEAYAHEGVPHLPNAPELDLQPKDDEAEGDESEADEKSANE